MDLMLVVAIVALGITSVTVSSQRAQPSNLPTPQCSQGAYRPGIGYVIYICIGRDKIPHVV